MLKNSSNEVLSAGSTANGDGCLVTLGYYSTSDSSSLNNHFNGDWIPLTEGTRIGDSSSGYGFEDGMFSFTTVFTFNSDTVNIFPTEPAFYQLSAPHIITQTAPPQANRCAFVSTTVARFQKIQNIMLLLGAIGYGPHFLVESRKFIP